MSPKDSSSGHPQFGRMVLMAVIVTAAVQVGAMSVYGTPLQANAFMDVLRSMTGYVPTPACTWTDPIDVTEVREVRRGQQIAMTAFGPCPAESILLTDAQGNAQGDGLLDRGVRLNVQVPVANVRSLLMSAAVDATLGDRWVKLPGVAPLRFVVTEAPGMPTANNFQPVPNEVNAALSQDQAPMREEQPMLGLPPMDMGMMNVQMNGATDVASPIMMVGTPPDQIMGGQMPRDRFEPPTGTPPMQMGLIPGQYPAASECNTMDQQFLSVLSTREFNTLNTIRLKLPAGALGPLADEAMNCALMNPDTVPVVATDSTYTCESLSSGQCTQNGTCPAGKTCENGRWYGCNCVNNADVECTRISDDRYCHLAGAGSCATGRSCRPTVYNGGSRCICIIDSR